MTPMNQRAARPQRRATRHVAIGAVLLVAGLSGACGWFRSSINDSPSLRWWLFSNFGVSQLCPKVLSSGIALRLVEGGSAIGRFFPNLCSYVVNDAQQTVTLSLGGTGFAWTPVAGRVGFSASAVVDYRMDFRLTEDAMYVWGMPTGQSPLPQFKLGAVENPVVNWAAQGPANYLASTFGTQILTSQLGQGFTAIRTDSGDEFTLGRLQPPARPSRPFALSGDERVVLANDSAEVHLGQVDMVGPLEVASDEQALYVRFRIQGAAADALVYARQLVDPWREGLQTGTPLRSPPGNPLAAFTLSPAQETRATIRLPRGSYVIVLDHSNQLGTTAPPFNPLGVLGGGSILVSYAIELGEAS